MSAGQPAAVTPGARSGLAREMGLLGLTATGICSMVGAGLNVIPFMIQRNVPGIGPNVLAAFLLGAVPAVFAGLAYAISALRDAARRRQLHLRQPLALAVSRLHRLLSQWFSLCVAIGVAYVITPFLRDIAVAPSGRRAATLESGGVRRPLPRLPVAGRGRQFAA
jgi:hypothetical protein